METPWTSALPRARILPAPVLDARGQAQEILGAAGVRAAELIDEATAAADSVRSAARDEGRDEGLAYAQRLLVEIQQERLRLLGGEEVRRMAIELALAMVRRVLGEAWDADPETWARAVLEAGVPLRRAGAISLRVAQGSVPAVRAALARELASGTVEVIGDAAIDEAGAIAISDCGRVDARLSTMLAAFRGPLGVEDAG